MKIKLLFLGITFATASTFVGCKGAKYAQQSSTSVKGTKEAEGQRVPLTVGLIQQYSLNSEHLQKLQFYLEGTIVLSTNIANKSVSVEGGDLLITSSNKPIDVHVKNGTAGIFQGVNKNVIAVRFEQDGNNRYLMFVPAQDGRYYLHGTPDGAGMKVMYDDRVYYADAASKMAYLSIGVRELNEFDPQKRIAPGVKLGEGGSSGGSSPQTNFGSSGLGTQFQGQNPFQQPAVPQNTGSNGIQGVSFQ